MTNGVAPDDFPQVFIMTGDCYDALVEPFSDSFAVLGFRMRVSRAQHDDPAGVAERAGRDFPFWFLGT